MHNIMPPLRGSYLFLHISRGFRLRQAYAVTSRRLRGSTPGLFYDAPNGAQKVGSLTLAGAPPQLPICGGPGVFRDAQFASYGEGEKSPPE